MVGGSGFPAAKGFETPRPQSKGKECSPRRHREHREGILFGHRPTRTGTGRGGFGPADLARPKLRALRAAGVLRSKTVAIGESLAQIDGLHRGRKQAPQASCLFIAGVSAAMNKRQAFLCRPLCLCGERSFWQAKNAHHGGTESTEKGILFGHRPTRTGAGRGVFGPADLARPKLRALRAAGCVEWRGYGLGRKSGANRWAESGEKPGAAGGLVFHCRPLSGNEKETGTSLRPLCLCGERSFLHPLRRSGRNKHSISLTQHALWQILLGLYPLF